MKRYEVLVVGGGHAGCEAASAAARLGCRTLLITLNLDTIAQMSCNPAIGGPAAKSHLVREIDALGGWMGQIIDETYLNIQMLNLSRGPAVHALRAQADKLRYRSAMTWQLESLPLLDLCQGMVTEVIRDDGGVGVKTKSGTSIFAEAVILCPGTFLRGMLVFGDKRYQGGRAGEPAAEELSSNLELLGFEFSRFQTATPPRVHADSVDYAKMEEKRGSERPLHFSFAGSKRAAHEQRPCYLTRTTRETIRVIENNLHRSPITTGTVVGSGPRFCPSIDRKVLRFPDKIDHQVFLEPEGLFTKELYCLGLTTSMPEDVQDAILQTIPGLEQARIMRAGYAVEYDYLLPGQFSLSLESRILPRLFTAGQINGTSGYEEAAAQGLLAGINAARKVRGGSPLILSRSQAYMGVLVDDLVTRGTDEPYRMMTSRAEYRLHLRQDNADQRLMRLGFDVGLVAEEQFERFRAKQERIEELMEMLQTTKVSPTPFIRSDLQALGSGDLKKAVSAVELLQRPSLSYAQIRSMLDLPKVDPEIAEQVEIQCRYQGYLERQERQVAEFRKLESIAIPAGMEYGEIPGLGPTARQQLDRVQPVSLGQAARIPGVEAGDIVVLQVVLKAMVSTSKRGNAEEEG